MKRSFIPTLLFFSLLLACSDNKGGNSLGWIGIGQGERPQDVAGGQDGNSGDGSGSGEGIIPPDITGGQDGANGSGTGSGQSEAPVNITVEKIRNGKVVTPVFDQPPGPIPDNLKITITCETENAKIYYTVNGDDPTASSTLYSESNKPIVTSPATLKAIAMRDDMFDSDIMTAIYGGHEFFVHMKGNDETGDGSKIRPFRTVGKGLNMANAARSYSSENCYFVRVAAGSYPPAMGIFDSIVVAGGYNASDWNDRKYQTEDDRENQIYQTICTIRAAQESLLGGSVSGFTMKESVWQPCISNNRNNTFTYADCTFGDSENPVVVGFTQCGIGTAMKNCVVYGGVLAEKGAFLSLANNTIYARGNLLSRVNLVCSGAAVCYEFSSGLCIENNTIIADAGDGKNSYGIKLLTFDSCQINYVSTIYNNTIDGGSGANSYGIAIVNTGITGGNGILKNKINGGTGSNSSTAIYLERITSDLCYSQIHYNELYTEGGGKRYGFYERNSGSDPHYFGYNLIYDCPTALYFDEGSINITNLKTIVNNHDSSNTLENWHNTTRSSFFTTALAANIRSVLRKRATLFIALGAAVFALGILGAITIIRRRKF